MTLVVKLVKTVPSEVHLSRKWRQIFITSNFTILIFSFFLFVCLVILTILLPLKRDLYEHFVSINYETGVGGVAGWTTAGYCIAAENAGKSEKWTEKVGHCSH